MISSLFLESVFFVIGLCFGSFANVCIYRVPRGISIIAPRSFCPKCQRMLNWYELIPLFSFVFLKGKCRTCSARISARYPIVELMSGLAILFLFMRGGPAVGTLVHSVFFLLLLIVGFIDWTNLVIPNDLIIVGLVCGVILFSFRSIDVLLTALLSAFFAGAVLFSIRAVGNTVLKKEAMGMGDVKLAVLIGFYLGIENTVIAVWFASVLGVLFWLFVYFHRGASRDERIPLGSLMALTSFLLSIVPIFHHFMTPFSRF